MTKYIHRNIESKLCQAHNHYPVILVTGPRQSGKSTLCRNMFPDFTYVNLENITERVNAQNDPVGYLDEQGDHVIIDEVQRVPDLLSMIQVSVDEFPHKKYVLTGSSNFTLMNAVCQSLAGRVAQYTLLPMSFRELPRQYKEIGTDEIMRRGFYPRPLIHDSDSFEFYTNYYNNYVERDLRDVVRLKNLSKFDAFIRLLALRTASEFNASALAKEAGVSATTISEWMSILESSYIVFKLTPYYANLGKQLTKMPKVYFTDTGLLCYLLGLETAAAMENSPLKGMLFENMAIAELVKSRYNIGREPRINFYRERSGKEVDAIVPNAEGLSLFEVKSSKTLRPDFIANMEYLTNLLPQATSKQVIYDGPTSLPLAVNIRDI